jgi:hypothetical protein
MRGTYGWFLRNKITGRLVKIDDALAGRGSVVENIRDADRFDTYAQARDLYDWLQSGSVPFPMCVIVDATIPADKTPDANPEDLKAKSREEVQAELKRQAAEYFAKHGHKVPLRRRGYGMRNFGGIRREPFGISVADKIADADGEVDDPSVGKAPELNASAPSAASPPASTSAEEAEAMRPFRPAFGRPTWP